MGMAASQARLLTLTARIHDVEYMAQTIQNAKLQLATKEDQIQQDYLDALDATTLTVKALENGKETTVVANFKNLFSIDRVQPASISKNHGKDSSYALHDKYGRLVVEQDVYDGYKAFKSEVDAGSAENNAYLFAMYMMDIGGNDIDSYTDAQETIYEDNKDDDATLKTLRKAIEEIAAHCGADLDNDGGMYGIENDIKIYSLDKDTDDYENYKKAINAYNNYLYSKSDYCEQMYVEANDDPENITEEDFDSADFQYYVNMFKQIEASGDCVSINDPQFIGILGTGDPENDSEWLKKQIESGTMSIDIAVVDKDGNVSFNGTSPSSDSNISYTNTTEIDSRAMKIAEAKYNHDMKQIDKKDKQFDMSLSKLETERTALTTEYDSVKKVTEDNIERTFGIFS